ncbi:MAG: DUF1080 domain-containing protein [Acidobacteriota bacterium]
MMRLQFHRRDLFSIVLAGSIADRAKAAGPAWISLFDGNSLNGWKAEGRADWSVQDGAILGRQGPGGAAGDLFTEQQWADFELEAEWSMHWPGNSGIWFRRAAPKTGYQADFLDQPSVPGILSGSLYCMGKAFIAENRDPATVIKDGWNRLRIRAVGEEIVIEQNGHKIVQVRDRTYLGTGSIGIQVHAGKQFEGMEVRIRKIRLQSLEGGGKR